jgi:hypothetical protein
MKKTIIFLAILALIVAFFSPPVLAQGGVIQSGPDTLALLKGLPGSDFCIDPKLGGADAKKKEKGSPSISDTKTGVSTTPVTYQNKVRNFFYTIPAGWRLERGDPTGNAERDAITFFKPGTTCGFTIHWTQLAPNRLRKVDASYKSAMEERGTGKYLVKRRDQGGKDGINGWEAIENAEKGYGSLINRIQWECYDCQNYFYTFIAFSEPKDFNANRTELQRIIDSIRFNR